MRISENGRNIKQVSFNTLDVCDLFLVGTEVCLKLEDDMYINLHNRETMYLESKFENVGSIDLDTVTLTYKAERL